MPRPATRPGNANKHPGQIVLEVSRVAHPKDVIAAERKKASAEKSAKEIALEDAQKKVAATEDAMAVEQTAQRAGPGHLVRPKPKPRPVTKAAPTANPDKMRKPYAIQCCCKTYQFFDIYTAVGAKPVSKSTDTPKKKYPGLKLTFKDGVNANRKVSNNGTSSTMCIVLSAGRGSDSGKNRRSLGSEHAISTEEVEVGKWAKSVASKSQRKPSAPPSARASVIASRDADISEDKNLPEDHDESVTVSWGSQGVVRMIETVDDATRGRKRTLSTTSLDDLEPEEPREMEEDDANEYILDKDEGAAEDEDEDVEMTDQQGDIIEVSSSRLTSSMSVSVMDTTMDGPTSKFVKTENGRAPRTILNLKKEKPKNSHLPSAVQNLSFCSIFIPTVMHWVGNNSYPWTIPDEKLSDILEDIFMAVCKQPGDFRNDDGCNLAFNVVCQRISEWRGNFSSTAITILMAFFASTDEFKTKEAHKDYAEYQLEDSRFVYEDPDNEDSPGVFLSEFILRIFAVQLNATQGHQIIDSLDFGLPGYQTALALTTAAAERALILARDNLIVEDTSDHGKHKIVLTLNQSTNKMSNTGTAFSAGNWETDTLVYMERIEELPFDRIKEIVERSQAYMKRARHKDESTILDGETPVNPRTRIRI
ncbi:hypothetical protein DFJ58DRAFT_734982 [Suillus subalutaceus]|uniref:uncharacterized protein n=1 Tax=Suillus subalutaceus TaxID=48586 RepID=UPI001B875D41|nr:uncharacterized protein DFJ58DRAFT_734982 [Suillus subalutaceus]KAG1836455.1 hypothetical protein DFJ58DRAFT_734982 [Suillus subalutaceus]